jgi:hypothetical protein
MAGLTFAIKKSETTYPYKGQIWDIKDVLAKPTLFFIFLPRSQCFNMLCCNTEFSRASINKFGRDHHLPFFALCGRCCDWARANYRCRSCDQCSNLTGALKENGVPLFLSWICFGRARFFVRVTCWFVQFQFEFWPRNLPWLFKRMDKFLIFWSIYKWKQPFSGIPSCVPGTVCHTFSHQRCKNEYAKNDRFWSLVCQCRLNNAVPHISWKKYSLRTIIISPH